MGRFCRYGCSECYPPLLANRGIDLFRNVFATSTSKRFYKTSFFKQTNRLHGCCKAPIPVRLRQLLCSI
jgi:hypothetical protein